MIVSKSIALADVLGVLHNGKKRTATSQSASASRAMKFSVFSVPIWPLISNYMLSTVGVDGCNPLGYPPSALWLTKGFLNDSKTTVGFEMPTN